MALTEKQLQAVDLIMTADMPFRQVAEAIGIHEGTLRIWREKDEFQQEISRRGQMAVDNALYQRAVVNKDPNAMKLWYSRYGDTPVRDDPLVTLLDLTEADMEEIANDAYEYIAAKRKVTRAEPRRPEA